jgi:hypothetical protein
MHFDDETQDDGTPSNKWQKIAKVILSPSKYPLSQLVSKL